MGTFRNSLRFLLVPPKAHILTQELMELVYLGLGWQRAGGGDRRAHREEMWYQGTGQGRWMLSPWNSEESVVRLRTTRLSKE